MAAAGPKIRYSAFSSIGRRRWALYPLSDRAMKQSQETRAKRRATKKNNKLDKDFPLFKGQRHTSAEKELIAIEHFDDYFKNVTIPRWKAFDERMSRMALFLRKEAALFISQEKLEQLDALVASRHYMKDPTYRADFWHGILNYLQGSPTLVHKPLEAEMEILNQKEKE